jgi:phytoene dehydrogenase-like protein
MSAKRYDVAVIGGGANGFTAATVLAKSGRSVVLLEREESLGGRGRVVEFAPGFRVAPLGMDPGWVPDPIARALGISVPMRTASPADVAVSIEPGRFLALSRDVGRTADAIATYSREDAAKWPAFVARLRALAGFLEALYLTPAPDISASSPGELLPLLGLARKFRGLGRRDSIEFLRTLPLSVWELLDDWFECGPLKAAVATGGIREHRQGPRSGATGFVLLHHLVGAAPGAVRARAPWQDGPDAFARMAEQAARRAGVELRTGAPVQRVEIQDDAVAGVVLERGDEIAASAVLSTASPATTFLDWIDPVWLDPEFLHAVGNIRYRGCATLVAYALERLPDLAGAGSEAMGGIVSLTPSLSALERAADAAKYGTVSERPHVEFTVPTLAAPSLAPEGRHVLLARMQYAPYRLGDGAVWDDARRDQVAKMVTSTIEAVSPCFSSRILHQAAWSPADLESRFGLREGASSQGELGLDQILFMRPIAGWGGHTTPIAGLYLGGTGNHPGPGVMGGAGWLAARRILRHRAIAGRRAPRPASTGARAEGAAKA